MLLSLVILLLAACVQTKEHYPPHNVTDPPPKKGFMTALDGQTACEAHCYIAVSHHANLWWSSVPHYCRHLNMLDFHFQHCHVRDCVDRWNFTRNDKWMHDLCRGKTHQWLWPEDGNGTEADIHPEDKILYVQGQTTGTGHWEKDGRKKDGKQWYNWFTKGSERDKTH